MAVVPPQAALKKFAAQLPEALELIARALRAGHSLAAGFNLVAQEMSDPIGGEFSRTFEEQNLGKPLEEALERPDQARSEPRPQVLRHGDHLAAANGR